MPHSLRAKLSGLRYKGILEDKDYKRLCMALDNEDVLDKIRGDIFDEIKNRYTEVRDKSMIQWCRGKVSGLKRALEIIDKYR